MNGDTSLIQTGTAQATSNGETSYYDWYEILPSYAVEIGTVSPGDHMVASVQKLTSATWTIAITDVTTGSVFSEPFSYSGAASSAEWIEEAPLINNAQSTLADFGSASFSSIADTNSGSSPVTQTPVEMINSGGSVIASPGSIASNAFTITYRGPVPPRPAVDNHQRLGQSFVKHSWRCGHLLCLRHVGQWNTDGQCHVHQRRHCAVHHRGPGGWLRLV